MHVKKWECGFSRRAPLHLRRALRLHLALRGRLVPRQHRHDPRPQGPGEPGRGRALVDEGPVEGGGETPTWTDPNGHLHAATATTRSARATSSTQLLARRFRHPRHLRHVEAEADFRARLVRRLRLAVPHLPAVAAEDRRAQMHDGCRRVRRAALERRRPGLRHDLRMVDITDATNPICVSSFRVPSEHSARRCRPATSRPRT